MKKKKIDILMKIIGIIFGYHCMEGFYNLYYHDYMALIDFGVATMGYIFYKMDEKLERTK